MSHGLALVIYKVIHKPKFIQSLLKTIELTDSADTTLSGKLFHIGLRTTLCRKCVHSTK